MPLTCRRCGFNIPIGRSFCPSCSLFVFSGQAISRPGSPRPADVIIGSARVSVDCAAAAVVDAIPILPQVIEAFIQHWTKPQMRAKLLGNGVRVSRDQFSEIHALVELQANALDLPLPEVFIKQSPELNAQTFGTNEDACIVVNSALVDLFDHDELGFILGHEMGHIKARHVVYGTALQCLKHGLLGLIPIPGISLIEAALDAWSRAAETTADRVGFLLVEDPVSAVRALALLAIGSRSLLNQMKLAPYLAQHSDLATFHGTFELYFGGNDHPHTVTRVSNLLEFAQTEAATNARTALLRPGRKANRGQIPNKRAQIAARCAPIRFCRHCGFETEPEKQSACLVCGGG